jgi:hypothetical protein
VEPGKPARNVFAVSIAWSNIIVCVRSPFQTDVVKGSLRQVGMPDRQESHPESRILYTMYRRSSPLYKLYKCSLGGMYPHCVGLWCSPRQTFQDSRALWRVHSQLK